MPRIAAPPKVGQWRSLLIRRLAHGNSWDGREGINPSPTVYIND